MIGIKYTVRHTIQLAFYGTAGLVVGVTGLTLFENQLPLDYRNKIDHLKTQLLCNDIFEEHRKVLKYFWSEFSQSRGWYHFQGQRSRSDRQLESSYFSKVSMFPISSLDPYLKISSSESMAKMTPVQRASETW